MRTVIKCIALLLAMGICTLDAPGEDPPASEQEKPSDTSQEQEDPPPSSEEEKDEPIFTWDYHWDWEKGLLYQYKQVIVLPFGVSMPHQFEDIKLEGKIGMNLMLDAAVYRETKEMPLIDNGFELRRALVKTAGNFYWGTPVDYDVEFQYVSDSGFNFREANLRFKELPTIGSVWVGQLTMPQGFAAIMSSKDIAFMEIASPLEALAPGSRFGVMIGDPILEERGTAALGLFTDTGNFEIGDATNALARFGGRVTYLPHINERHEELDLLHLGFSSSLVYSPDAQVRYQSRPESHLAPELIDTGNIEGDIAWVSGFEGAAVWGPLYAQSELLASVVRREEGDPLNFWGAYAHVGWFVTGEIQPYKRDGGYFGHLIPNQPIQFPTGTNQGAGALELAARVSYTDLTDEEVKGGRMGILMTGATWFLSRNVRILFNVGAATVDRPGADGGLYIVQTRLQWTY